MGKRAVERRLRAKRERERMQRKHHRRMRMIRVWATVVVLVGGGVGLYLAFKPGPRTTGALGTPTPSPSGFRCPVGVVPAHNGSSYPSFPETVIDTAKKYLVTVDTTCGTIKMTLDPKLAPKAVNSFVFLAREGFYAGSKIHRVVNNIGRDAIIQGGDPKGDGTGGPGYQFEIEKPKAGATYARGTVAMANSGGTASNGSQFFIVVRDWPDLPPDYTIFGAVTDLASLELLDNMVQVSGTPLPGGLGTGPVPNIGIIRVTVSEIPA